MANVKETIAALKRANEILKTEAEYSTALIECQRMLLSEDELHEVQALGREVGAAVATVEVNYGMYGRISPFSKKFIVQK